MKIETSIIEVENVFYEVAKVVGVEGYSASRCGKTFSHKFGRIDQVGALDKFNNRLQVSLTINGKLRTVNSSRLVLSAFTGVNIDTPLFCLHNNGDSTDDRIENLRWGTATENMKDSGRHGTRSNQKLTYHDCREIIKIYNRGGTTQSELGGIYGVDQTRIYQILRNHNRDSSYYDETEFEVKEIANG